MSAGTTGRRGNSVLVWCGLSLLLAACGAGGGQQSAAPAADPVVTEADGAGVDSAELDTQAVNAQGYSWRTLKVGAGGYITGLDFSRDGSLMLARTDTYGLYRWTGRAWKQLITAASMPAGEVRPGRGVGVLDVAVAPGNRRVYMAWDGAVYRSDTRGDRWAATALNLGERLRNENDDWRTWGGKLVVDPRRASTVLLGTPRDGLYRTTDAGASWARVASLPAGQPEKDDGSGPGVTAIAYDPSQPGMIYASSHKNGVFRSADGGAHWQGVPGSPPTLARAEVGADGTLYGATGTGLWRLRAGVWTALNPASADDIATVTVSPGDARRVVAVASSGDISQSLDGGDTWQPLSRTLGGGDIPWLDQREAGGTTYFTTAQVRFDPRLPDRLWAASGIGVFRADVAPGGTSLRWQGQSRGIEQLVGNDVVAPPGGQPVVAAWDFGTFHIANPDQYAARMAIPRPVQEFNSTWQLDYQGGNPSFMVGNTSDHRYCCAEDGLHVQAGYSEDGGQTWTRFSTIPGVTGLQYGEQAFGFGSIAVSSHDPDNIVWMPTFNRTPVYTLDRGRSWNGAYLPGLEFAGDRAGSHFAPYLSRKVLVADKSLPGTFYLAHGGVQRGEETVGAGLWRTHDGGRSWALVYRGEVGLVNLFNATLKSVPGQAGQLFFTSGKLDGEADFSVPFRRSNDGGVTWTDVPGLSNVHAFGFGKAAAGTDKATLFAAGYQNRQWGLWRSTDDARTWRRIGDYPQGSLDTVRAIDGDKAVFGRVYLAFGGSGFGYGVDRSVR